MDADANGMAGGEEKAEPRQRLPAVQWHCAVSGCFGVGDLWREADARVTISAYLKMAVTAVRRHDGYDAGPALWGR